jgi:hypothetical protein
LGWRDHRDHPLRVRTDVVDRDEVGGEVPLEGREQAVGELVEVEQSLDVADQFEQLVVRARDREILRRRERAARGAAASKPLGHGVPGLDQAGKVQTVDLTADRQ